MQSWILQPIINPIAVAVISVAILLLLLVGPSFSELTRSRRWTLTSIRLAVILMALLAMLRPGCVQKVEKNQSAVLLFLIDVSRSMELPHVSDDSTRWGAIISAIEENQSRFEQLRENKIDVRFFAFNNQIIPLETVDGKVVLPKKPEGSETDIGTAVFETSQDVRDERLIGVIVASDGVQNAPYPEVELTNAAETLRDMEVPLYAVTLGLPGDTGQLADLAITNLPEQHRVSVKNTLTVRANLVARGYANQAIGVQLIVVDSQGKETVLPTEFFTPTKPYEEIPVELTFSPPEPGRFRIKVRALPQPGEVAIRNNELPSFLTVDEHGMGVLYIEGNIGYESKFLRQTIADAAQGIDLDDFTIYETTRNQWPFVQLEELFKDQKYDVIIIGDLDSSALSPKALDELANAVFKGKGLLMLGGYHSFGPGRYQLTPLADILPIQMDRNEGQDFSPAKIRKELHIDRPLTLRPTKDHYLTRLTSQDDYRAIWKQLPKLAGANFFVGVKDSAEVLLESEQGGNPILVAGHVGAGRVIAFAGDTTWRWLRHGFQDEYKRFWRQIIFWLTFRDGKSDDSVRVFLTQRRFAPKSKITFTVDARTMTGELIRDAEYKAVLINPAGESVPIVINQSTPKNETTLEKSLVEAPGLYKIRVSGSRNGAPIGETEEEFIVFDRDKEIANPAANPEQMARLASQTREFGGKALVPEQLGELLDDIIKNPPSTKIEIPTKWRLGETMTDATAFLLTFVMLLTAEWALRKKWGLV